eukprot:CAMPEP_0196598458 /NCGR_PEP_ID=MMETSP1081-20130531/94332_1 /TAXON_ID=36882 /ORGANISM="Pyramimonas amylifera, Strain CCMP720" /LENGTH=177 /DNA_ID=CAMNT_0041924157 /DNA_START=170 /DNA_END=703 /DNA_ORIENTATION=-
MSVTLKTQKQNEINGLNNGKKSMIKVCTRKSIGKYMSGQEKSNKKMKKFVRLVINGVCEAEKSTIQDLTGYSCEQLPKPKLNNLLENICPGLCLENENWRDIKRDGYIECVNAYSKFSGNGYNSVSFYLTTNNSFGQEKSNKKMKKFVRLVINGVCEAEKSTIQIMHLSRWKMPNSL